MLQQELFQLSGAQQHLVPILYVSDVLAENYLLIVPGQLQLTGTKKCFQIYSLQHFELRAAEARCYLLPS